MSLSNKKPVPEIVNIEHENSGYKKVVAHGQTTGGDILPLKLNDDGTT